MNTMTTSIDNTNYTVYRKTAIVSVFDKTNLDVLGTFLKKNNYNILSTGGTAKYLLDRNIHVTEVSDYTGMPEILNGRVKTLHPKLYGGILNVSSNDDHQKEIKQHSITNIDLVVVNLYPFELNHTIENIDIGGVTLIRAAAKNYNDVSVITNPSQYQEYIENIKNDRICPEYRQTLATAAFKQTSHYDTMIHSWFNCESDNIITRKYEKKIDLKYGCNPHQKIASILTEVGGEVPFNVINGSLGYVNVLDAINSWKLVNEVKMALHKPCATSFKHVSPAGVGLGSELRDNEKEFINATGSGKYSQICIAYMRARACDPKSSFGDFIAVNETVDTSLAKFIKGCVSDGIIAPSYTPDAIAMLKLKKNGGFLILEGKWNDKDMTKNETEYRDFGNFVLSQEVNKFQYTKDCFTNTRTHNVHITNDNLEDMIMSSITMKYTQSNSVGYAFRGQMIGIGAGQQSRIDCAILARKKAEVWILRHSNAVNNYISELVENKHKNGEKMKRQDIVNATISYIENHMDEIQNYKEYCRNFGNIVINSDGFFPFRDSIDEAAKVGVTHVVQPGGSIADKGVINACNEYNMCMVTTGVRAFHH